MRAVAIASKAVLVVALAGAGCDWREFDELKKKVPVASIEAPPDYPAGDDFGPILLPIAPPADGSAAGRFVATATHRTSVGVISFNAAGQPSGLGVTGPAYDILQQGPITAIAAVPGGQKALLGAPSTSLGDLLVMTLEPPYATSSFLPTVGEPQYGVGVGAGHLGGGAAPEFIVLSSNILHVYVDGQPSLDSRYESLGTADPCPIDFSALLPEADRVNRAVIVAPLLATGTQIAVGTPTVSGAGHVLVFDFDVGTGAVTCAAVLIGTEAHFGQAMALADLVPDPDHKPDHLVVGAPRTRAYLYSLPLTTGATPVAMASDTMTDGRFGAAVAAFDIDGKPGDEIFIGNPDATVGDTTTAGRVSVYTGTTLMQLPAALPNPLTEHEPGAGHGYGAGVAGMTFCPGFIPSSSGADAAAPAGDGGVASCTKLPIVGSLSKVYTYFTLKKPDPRVQ